MKQYDSYKDSGIEWIGEIPSHWEVKRLKYLFKSITTKAINDSQKIGLENIESKSGKYIETDSDFEGDGIAFDKNDILYGKLRPYLAKVWLAEFRGSAVGDFFVLRVRTDVISQFSKYLFLSSLFTEIANSSTFGSKMPRVSWEFLANLLFPLPLLSEQTAIATYLDRKTSEIDQLIADKKRLVELYEEEKTAIINQAVTKGIDANVKMKDSGIEWLGEVPEHWEVKRLKYYFDLITEKKENNQIKVGLENIESKTGKFIETASDFEGTGITFIENDILFGKLRPYLAKVWLAKFNGQAVGDFYIFRSKDSVLPAFAKYRILDSSFIEVCNSSTYGSKMPRVNWEFILNLFIAFPPLAEQQSIVRHIETECNRIDAKIAKTKKLISLLTEYRTALISEVVTGKIKVVNL